ncbi:hypothetical protein KDW_47340 [Dictyobacter vulcani]|uniref:HTH cro/C1-type domain-containing protein n=1 Tax=Dictyobacter vulcani TaxID=2607529 RepID=A0A5J4KTR3_9CHLR|nr:helix-turn-helix domain-containing protein [Dictyobacter vulcani]GER90572.1 hypothetical protein KDW_47340 [Dictyobacter vulcani]
MKREDKSTSKVEKSTTIFEILSSNQSSDKQTRRKVQSGVAASPRQTWRDLLAQIIRDEEVKQQIIDALHISPVTLSRWITGKSEPRAQNLQQLLNTLPPQYQEQMALYLREENKLPTPPAGEDGQPSLTIPSEFYQQVFMAHATTSENLRFWSLCQLIIQQALGQLDPERRGMSIWVVCCMPPSGTHNKVRSLRESVGAGTSPWQSNLEQEAMFLGAESLVGNVVTSYRPAIVQDLDEDHSILSFSRVEHEKSIAIYPILYCGRIAGVFMVSSAETNFFLDPGRIELIPCYADLCALAFENKQFYTANQIALEVMPTYQDQKAYFVHFRQIMTETILDVVNSNNTVNNTQVDLLVWQKLEAALVGKKEDTLSS